MELILKHGVCLFDDGDAPLVQSHSWHSMKSTDGKRIYAASRIAGRTTYMHSLILNRGSRYDVDHLNRDTLDNRRQNLRVATRSQNMANAESRGGSSRFKGVCFVKRLAGGSKPWMAQIQINGKRPSLGYYATEEEAARAYDAAALAAWGEFARLNMPDQIPKE